MILRMDEGIQYAHKQSKRAKRIRLAVYCDGRVVVTSPFGIRQSIIEKFIADKKQWILKKIRFFQNIDRTGIRPFSYKDYVENKDDAFALVNKRVEFYNRIYGFSFHNISIKNHTTRWGSCSSKRNLNFNYRILFLPTLLQDYIIVHELCHLQEFNHSRKFWALVTRAAPHYVEIKKELRHYGLLYQ